MYIVKCFKVLLQHDSDEVEIGKETPLQMYDENQKMTTVV